MLTVMTYNVGAGLAAPLRLVELLRQSGADIIGLQELAPEQGEAIADLLGRDYPHQVPHATGLRVDYIWHTAHFRALASWIGGNAGSDHLPVLAELERVDG